MVIISRGADEKSVAQLTCTPTEQAQLRSMLNPGKNGLDQYTKAYAEFVYKKYKAANCSVTGTDLEAIMKHVGFVPN